MNIHNIPRTAGTLQLVAPDGTARRHWQTGNMYKHASKVRCQLRDGTFPVPALQHEYLAQPEGWVLSAAGSAATEDSLGETLAEIPPPAMCVASVPTEAASVSPSEPWQPPAEIVAAIEAQAEALAEALMKAGQTLASLKGLRGEAWTAVTQAFGGNRKMLALALAHKNHAGGNVLPVLRAWHRQGRPMPT